MSHFFENVFARQFFPRFFSLRKKPGGFGSRVARWFIFEPKIPIWINFGRSWNEKCWHISWPFRIVYGHLV
jgi:hypothetical protein